MSLYDLSKDSDRKRFQKRVFFLMRKNAKADLTEKKTQRSNSQNKYLHVLFGLFGIDKGFTLEESKTFFKRKASFMIIEKELEGAKVKFLRSTANLDKSEMTDFIDIVRTVASKHGCYLPTPQ